MSFPNFYLAKTWVKKLRNKQNQTKSQGMWLRQKTKIRVNLWIFHIGILFPGEGKAGQKTFLQEKEAESDNCQQVTADPICNQTLKQILPRTQNWLDKWTELTNDPEILDIYGVPSMTKFKLSNFVVELACVTEQTHDIRVYSLCDGTRFSVP